MSSTPQRRYSNRSVRDTTPSVSEEDAASINYVDEPHTYYSTLNKISLHSRKVRIKENEQEKTLMAYLPVNEQYNQNKEGKVLARWQERQKDWENIQAKISKSLSSKSKKPLMMATTDEFRAKIEEYDLLQAAIPIKDRYSGSAWEVSLRGGGPLTVSVGHVFSGLECSVNIYKTARPKIFRKPRTADQITSSSNSFMEETASFVEKKKKLEKNIKELRPHTISYSDTMHLVVKTQDLFQWAKESTDEFFRQQELNGLSAIREDEGDMEELGEESVLRSLSHASNTDAHSAKVEFLSKKEIVMVATDKKQTSSRVSFKNVGSVALSYKWKRVPSPQNKNEGTNRQILTKILNTKQIESGQLRARSLNITRECFFCLKDEGVVLPAETVDTLFVFMSRAGGGTFYSEWILEFTPSAVIQSNNPYASPISSPSISIGFTQLYLRAQCSITDESISKRNVVSSFVENQVLRTMMEDVIQSCIGRVRLPVRIADVHQRQIALFLQLNEDLLSSLSKKFGLSLPIFVTIERIHAFVDAFLLASSLFDRVRAHLFSLRQIENPELNVTENTSDQPFAISEECKSLVLNKLLPEESLEIFDEVTMDDLLPLWTYKISDLFAGLQHISTFVNEIIELEDTIRVRVAQEEKERIRQVKLETRRAATDEDDEDEEEEDEEEEDEEKGSAVKVIENHPLLQEMFEAEASAFGSLYILTSRVLPEQFVKESFKTLLADSLEGVNDARTKAISAANLDQVVANNLPIRQLHSPFTSEAGQLSWELALSTTSAEPPEELDAKGKVKGKSKPKAKGKKDSTPDDATPEQVNFFYRILHDEIRSMILDMAELVVEQVDNHLFQKNMHELDSHVITSQKLFDVATLRTSDLVNDELVHGRPVFINFDGAAFTAENVNSAFDVRKQAKLRATQPVLSSLKAGAKTLVLLYESDSKDNQMSVLSEFDLLQAIVQQQWEEHKVENMKTRKKQKLPPLNYKDLNFFACKSAAELKYFYGNVLKCGKSDMDSFFPVDLEAADAYFRRNIPIFLMENLNCDGVIAEEPEFENVESDDDEGPIPIGIEEIHSKRLAKWNSKRPHKVKAVVKIPLSDPTAGGSATLSVSGSVAGTVTSRIRQQEEKIRFKTVDIEVYADTAAAIGEAFAMDSVDALWVEANFGKVFCPPQSSAFHNLGSSIGNRFVSDEIRELFMLAGVVQLLPVSQHFINEIHAANEANQAALEAHQALLLTLTQGETIPASPEKVEAFPLAEFIGRLFPYSVQQLSAPNSSFVLGGQLNMDKFRVLDQLLDLVSKIYSDSTICSIVLDIISSST